MKSNSSTSNSEPHGFTAEQPSIDTRARAAVVSFAVRVLGFLGASALLYVVVLFLAVNGASDRLRFTNVPMASPPRTETLVTFRQVRDYRDLDIVFLGSSHANRSFDPRFFDQFGLRTFTLGTLSQSPLNTYYVLRDYLQDLNPRLAVFEVYWGLLASDGAESAMDLVGNLPITTNLLRMVLATRNVRVFNTLARRILDVRRPPLDELQPQLRPKDTYRGRGYIERALDFEGNRSFPRDRIDVSRRQLRYLERCIRLLQRHRASVVLIVQPLPEETLASIGNRDDIDRRLRALAQRHDVPYIDFNQVMALESTRYFYDYHHLNQRGVDAFLPRLYDELRRRNLIEVLVEGPAVRDTIGR